MSVDSENAAKFSIDNTNHFSQHCNASGHFGHIFHLDEVVQIEEVLFRHTKSLQILEQHLNSFLSIRSSEQLQVLA